MPARCGTRSLERSPALGSPAATAVMEAMCCRSRRYSPGLAAHGDSPRSTHRSVGCVARALGDSILGMRLSDEERNAILDAVRHEDPDAEVWLFGSRADDRKLGGDIDIAVRSSRVDRVRRRAIRAAIHDRIGLQRIDIVISADGADPFFRHAVSTGVRLETT
jgi:uncharacterized protein